MRLNEFRDCCIAVAESKLDRIKGILNNYDDADGGKRFKATVAELCKTVIEKCSYQDDEILSDIFSIFNLCDDYIDARIHAKADRAKQN